MNEEPELTQLDGAVYVLAICAFNFATRECRLHQIAILANDERDAAASVLPEAYARFPPAEGWGEHRIVCAPTVSLIPLLAADTNAPAETTISRTHIDFEDVP